MFFDYEGFCKFLEEAVTHYERSAPAVSDYLDNLYIRINAGDDVLLDEVRTATGLKQDSWMHPNHAQNWIYKLMARHNIKPTQGILINDW